MGSRPKNLSQSLATRLRQDIQTGVWGSELPGESVLASYYSVSRSTMRNALSALESERIISESSQGKRRHVLSGKRKQISADRSVVILTNTESEGVLVYERPFIQQLVAGLGKKGVETILLPMSLREKEATQAKLEKLVRRFGRPVWLLHRCPPKAQRWFHENQKGRCLVLGPSDPDLPIPDVQTNQAKLMSEALARFAEEGVAGHEVLFVIRQENSFLFENARKHFLDAVAQVFGSAASPTILTYSGNSGDLVDGLDRVFAEKAKGLSKSFVPPKALLVWRTHDALTVYCYLLARQQLRTEASQRGCLLISAGWLPSFSAMHPSLSYFQSPDQRHLRIVISRLIRLADGMPLPEKTRLSAHFHEGETG